MARYPKKATYRTFVIDSKTGEWKQIDPKDIPQNKIDELCDKFALGAGYQNPDILYFYGLVNGKKSQLIQHASQLNFLLTSVEREDKTKPARRIGFANPNDASDQL